MAKLTDFKYARWIGGANLYAQAVLLFLLFLGTSYFASQNFTRVDLSKGYRYSLAPETIAHLQQLDRPVKIYVTITSDSDDSNIESLFNDVRGLLREYEYAVNSPDRLLIDVEFVNIYQQRRKANLLADEYGVEQSDLILLVSGEKRRIVFPNELYVTEGRVRKEFLGEKILTGAILDVASDQQKKLYFLTGHGEMRIDDV
ncbi:MAG TPA: Gldg family protein, partial [Opitutales bacterium]|nr:Gldg family protein [Opitutales bacterium]